MSSPQELQQKCELLLSQDIVCGRIGMQKYINFGNYLFYAQPWIMLISVIGLKNQQTVRSILYRA